MIFNKEDCREGSQHSTTDDEIEEIKYQIDGLCCEQIILGGKAKGFDIEDAIFELSDGRTDAKDLHKCTLCQTVLKSVQDCRATTLINKDTGSNKVMCQFCGWNYCQNCTKKSRPFPKSYVDPATKRHTARGTICKYCDRKFFVKAMVDTIQTDINAQMISIKNGKAQQKNHKQELKAQQEKHEEQLQLIIKTAEDAVNEKSLLKAAMGNVDSKLKKRREIIQDLKVQDQQLSLELSKLQEEQFLLINKNNELDLLYKKANEELQDEVKKKQEDPVILKALSLEKKVDNFFMQVIKQQSSFGIKLEQQVFEEDPDDVYGSEEVEELQPPPKHHLLNPAQGIINNTDEQNYSRALQITTLQTLVDQNSPKRSPKTIKNKKPPTQEQDSCCVAF